MADAKISALTALGAAPAVGDRIPIVDVSDTTQAASGTTKYVATSDLFTNPAMTSSTTVKVTASSATPSANVFQVGSSDGSTTKGFIVQSDLGVIINQVTGATYSQLLDVKYQGTTQFSASYNGTALAKVGFNGGGGAFTTDASGNVVALGNITGKHLLGNGTSPTVADNGGNDSTIAGKDTACKVTVGTGSTTTITITFGTAYATAPVCVVSGSVSSDIKVATTTTTAVLTHAGFTDGEVLHVVCIGF